LLASEHDMATSGQSRRRVRAAALLSTVSLFAGSLVAQVAPSQGDNEGVLHQGEVLLQRALLLRKAQTNKSLRASTLLFKESARLFESARANDQAAEAYLEAGDIYFLFSQYRKARQVYSQALRLGTEDSRCKAVSRVARTYATTGAVALAQQHASRALDICLPLGGRAEAEALEAHGEAVGSAGENAKSVEDFHRAAEVFAGAKDENATAQTLLMLAAALYSDGRQEAGLEAAGRALQLWTSLDDSYGLARIRAALGIFAITRGEFETARCNYKIAEPLLHTLGIRDEEASVLNGLGYTSRETGDWETSLQYYRRARIMFASVQDLLGEHEAITGMATALLAMRRYQELLPLYTEELKLARRSGQRALVASSLGDMAALYEGQKKYETAEQLYLQAIETYRSVNHLYGEGDILLRLGRLQALRGKDLEALKLLDSANAMKEKTGQIEEVAKVQYEKARVCRNLDRLDEAKSAIEKTIEIVEEQRVTISKFDSRASYFASVHRYYALYIELLMLLDKRDSALGFARKAFEASERSKVRSLLDLLTTSAKDASCEELLGNQLQKMSMAESREQPTARPSNLATATLTLDQVQAEIESEGTILLEYALGEDKSYLWVVSRNRSVSYELPESGRIRRLVVLLRENLLPPLLGRGESATDYQARVRKMGQEFEVTSRELSRLLLGPVDLAQAKRILIVPDGALQYTPFAALPLPTKMSNAGPLIAQYEVDILPSASVLGALRKIAVQKGRPSAAVAIIADPVFERDDPRVMEPPVDQPVDRKVAVGERPAALSRAIRDGGRSEYIPRLSASRDEANAIAAIFRSDDPLAVRLALDFDASRERILREGLAQFRLIHFATHGIVDARHPEMSGLILSLVNARGGKQDGYLRIGDIYKLKLAADLIVLSSCDSALGKDLESEGIIGLPRAFLYAGAKSVIASSWKVSDEATAKLMMALYARIRNGENSGSALRGAQLEMLRDERWSKPYYWAAFAVQGEYR
jgi:CHAT domain-containing protein